MRTESLCSLLSEVWQKHRRIRNHLDGVGRQLGELARTDAGASDSDAAWIGSVVDELLRELRDLKKSFASEVRLDLPRGVVAKHPEFVEESHSIARQRRALRDQIENLQRLATSTRPPACGWSGVLSHFHLLASPFRAYLVQRCDLLTRAAHLAEADSSMQVPVRASAPPTTRDAAPRPSDAQRLRFLTTP